MGRPRNEKIIDKGVYRFEIDLHGSDIKYLKKRAEKAKRTIRNEASLLITELLRNHGDDYQNDLISSKWKHQNEITKI